MWGTISTTIFKFFKNIFTGDTGRTESGNISGDRKSDFNINNGAIDYADIGIDLMKMFDTLSEGIIVFDNYGKLIIKNNASNGFLEDGVDITYIDKFIDNFDIGLTFEELIYIENKENKKFFINKNGKYFKLQFFLYYAEEKNIRNIIVSLSDYSEQKSLDDRRKDFVANVSHELKTPLTSILSYTEALADDDISKKTRDKFLNVIIDEANRMDRLIGNLLQLSKLTSDKYSLNRRRYSFSSLINNCIEKIRLDAHNHHLTINKYMIGELPEVMMDVDRMEQVILNILSNAIKYTPAKGIITIYAGKNYNQVYAKITDNGIGIPQEHVNMVFERFYRVDKARSRQQGGTGLGLAISKEIVEAHSGVITVSSEFGKGTDVMIKIPIKTGNKAGYEYPV